MNNEPVSVVTLLVALLTFVTSKEVASLLGPYAAIVVAASGGAAVSLSWNKERMEKWWHWTWYIAVRVLLAFVLSVSISQAVEWQVPELKVSYTLVPVALGIGLIPDYKTTFAIIGVALSKMLPKWITSLGKREDGK